MAENDHSTDTRMAQRQTGRLQRTLGRFDIVFLIFSAVVGLEMLGSWVSIFPGTLETLLGVDYDFSQASGVSYASFEALTLGTLAFIVLLALVGYIRGRRVREYRD